MAAPETRILVIGGHSRNIGKTTLVVDLIRALPEAAWTAVRITQYGHNICSLDGEACGCAPATHAFALEEERNRSGRADTSRFLAAGAARSLWLRVKQGCLSEAMPWLRAGINGAGNVIIESNSLLQFLAPRLYLVVLEPRQHDFKDSARRFLDRADAFVLRSPLGAGAWSGVSNRLIEEKPCFEQPLGGPLPEAVAAFVSERFFGKSKDHTRRGESESHKDR